MIKNRALIIPLLVLLVILSNVSIKALDKIPGRFTGKNGQYVAATDSVKVRRQGAWTESYFRYGATTHLATREDGAALEYMFEGNGLVLLLDNHNTPEYHEPNLGRLVAIIDDGAPVVIYPQSAPLEITVARNLPSGKHRLRLVHQLSNELSGCRIVGFQSLSVPNGDLEFNINGEENAFLVNARAVLTHEGQVVRSTLVRNRLNGVCRMAGLDVGAGYELEIQAMGWEVSSVDGIGIKEGCVTRLDPIYLKRDERARNRRHTRFPIHWPRLGHPVVHRPGETFRVRVASHQNKLKEIILRRIEGPAVISQRVPFTEHPELDFYYDHEMSVQIPDDIPPGLYDLLVLIHNPSANRDYITISPQSVYLVDNFPDNPVFVTFGHLDTSSQFQAEYLGRMAQMANLIAPDMVLVSNEVNPAYVSGALAALRMPYLITFGNHQVPGNQYWYGEPVGITDLGPGCTILNFGLQWHTDLSKAHNYFSSREKVPLKIINAYEQNAPVEDFLDRYRVAMLHDAHGTGKKVMEIGATPTVRVGKVNASSFRIVRFRENRVVSCTYRTDSIAPYPFPRELPAPLRVEYLPANNGNHRIVEAKVTNELFEDISAGRVTFVLPAGNYLVDGGRLETTCTSDDGKYVVLTVRADFPSGNKISITVYPE